MNTVTTITTTTQATERMSDLRVDHEPLKIFAVRLPMSKCQQPNVGQFFAHTIMEHGVTMSQIKDGHAYFYATTFLALRWLINSWYCWSEENGQNPRTLINGITELN